MSRFFASVALLCCLFFVSCSTSENDPVFSVAISSYPNSFNPVMSTGNPALEVNRLVYEFLHKIDSTGTVRPYLSKRLEQQLINDTLSLARTELSDLPRWPNGEAVTAADIAVSIKLRRTPLIRSGSPFDLAPIQSARLVNNAIELELKGNPQYTRTVAGDFMVVPEYIYDSLQILRKYDLEYLSRLDPSNAPADLLQYATAFNSLPPYDSIFFEASGPYKIESFVPDQNISLKLREDWWNTTAGAKLPPRINFVVIPDATAARFALQNGDIDLITQVPATEFVQLENFNRTSNTLNLYRQAGFRFIFIGFNTRLPKFSDARTRLAIHYLLDIPAIIDAVKLGFADQTVGPVHPVLKDLYSDSLPLREYRPDTVAQLLTAAGWKFENNEWRDQAGERLAFTIKYNGANKDYEKIALIVKEAAAKQGIQVEVSPEDAGTLTPKLRSHQFEATIWSFVGSPTAFDFTPLFHSAAAAPGRLNFTGFGNAASDAAIEQAVISTTRDDMGRQLKQLQQIIYEESPMIFLYYEQSLIAASKKYPSLNISFYKPGYDPVGVF